MKSEIPVLFLLKKVSNGNHPGQVPRSRAWSMGASSRISATAQRASEVPVAYGDGKICALTVRILTCLFFFGGYIYIYINIKYVYTVIISYRMYGIIMQYNI